MRIGAFSGISRLRIRNGFRPRVLKPTQKAPPCAGVYAIVDRKTRQVYIGASQNLFLRIRAQRAASSCNANGVYRAMQARGPNAISAIVLMICPESELSFHECAWIRLTKSVSPNYGFNHKLGAGNNNVWRTQFNDGLLWTAKWCPGKRRNWHSASHYQAPFAK